MSELSDQAMITSSVLLHLYGPCVGSVNKKLAGIVCLMTYFCDQLFSRYWITTKQPQIMDN